MKSILVIDDMPAICEPIALAIQLRGYQAMRASNGNEGLRLCVECMPDLILLDLEMPVMDGLTFLRELRQMESGTNVPVIILTSHADRSQVCDAAKLGVSGYLLKSRFSMAQLFDKINEGLEPPVAAQVQAPQHSPDHAPEQSRLEAIGRFHPNHLTTASDQSKGDLALAPILRKSEVEDLILKCKEFKSFSPAVAEVIKLTESDRCSIEQVAQAVNRDHAIALKVLKLANSVIYTRGEPVDSVHKAVMRIGMQQIRQAVLNIALIDRFNSDLVDGLLEAGQFWEHAIATGIIAAAIARTRNDKEVESAFTAGLLHDAGRMLFITELGEPYREVIQTANRTGLPLEIVEQRLLGYSHAAIMDQVLRSWKFSKDFIRTIVFHHLSASEIRSAAPKESMQIATLALADRLAHALMLGFSGNETIYPTEDLCDLLQLDSAVLVQIEQMARNETDNVKLALLARSDQSNWKPWRDQCREQLKIPCCHVYVGASPSIDSYRVLFDQLRTETEASKLNLAVLRLQNARDRQILSQSLVEMEQEMGLGPLPLLVITNAQTLVPEQALLHGRSVEMLTVPAPLSRIIAAINSLLAEQYRQAAA